MMDQDTTTEATHTVAMLRRDLQEVFRQSYARGLLQSSKWASEMLRSLKDVTVVESLKFPERDPKYDKKSSVRRNAMEDCDYMFAKCVFDFGEFKRSAFLTEKLTTPEAKFLHFYSRYMAIEKDRKNLMVEPSAVLPDDVQRKFFHLKEKILNLFERDKSAANDAYIQYILGITYVKIGMTQAAIDALIKSINIDAMCICSWNQLSYIIEDESSLNDLFRNLPCHWLRNFFMASALLELQNYHVSLWYYQDLERTFFESNFIRQQIALIYDATLEKDRALQVFAQITLSDPFRLEGFDVLSNLLFISGDWAKLSRYAFEANEIEPFRMETCCAIANFYIRRGNHEKAVIYFSRALLLNPNHASAWVLMGHEYVELKNPSAAIQAYRSALACNKRNFRAWYGLGQVYEIQKMFAYALYYYEQAHYLQPKDHRFLEALGHIYEKLGRNEKALTIYVKAGPPALLSLGLLYEKIGRDHEAAAAFNTFISNYPENKDKFGLKERTLAQCYINLGNYFVKYKKNPLANRTGVICMNLRGMREDCRDLLKQAKMFVPHGSDEEESEEQNVMYSSASEAEDDDAAVTSDDDVTMEL